MMVVPSLVQVDEFNIGVYEEHNCYSFPYDKTSDYTYKVILPNIFKYEPFL